MTSFPQVFQQASRNQPHPWQQALADDQNCRNRLIRIPTGFGKTAGTVLPWLWHRVVRNDSSWPLRLAFCLPMRVLVEQTEASIRQWLGNLELLWDAVGDHAGKVGVHVLMGGCDAGDWHLHPEHPAILIGTQDMLLSRALNRGYASPRARWPMEFGLLNQDCLWVVDEVQLMDVGLATAAQLQAFRHEDEQAGKSLRPCRTWWMSATLQPRWMESVDTTALLKGLPPMLEIPEPQRTGTLWQVQKPREIAELGGAKDAAGRIAALAQDAHRPGTLTLVVANRVDDANAVFDALAGVAKQGIDLRLVHSRFRHHERRAWREAFLTRGAAMPAAGRIIIATQVVEAGVDLNADTLITDLAPWPSLVQRFGRCARYGGTGRVIVADRGIAGDDDKAAAPYAAAELAGARDALGRIADVSPAGLERFEAELSAAQRAALYPYAPRHLLLRREWDELFDTTPDLTGADLDISRFIRSGDERDCLVFWDGVAEGGQPSDLRQPRRDELCPMPFLRVRDWLCGAETSTTRKPRLRSGMRAWTWDWIDGAWKPAERAALAPGRIVCVAAACGGYLPDRGVDPDADAPVPVVAITPLPAANAAEEQADASQSGEPLSRSESWKTIATHGGEVGRLAHAIAHGIGVNAHRDLLALAGRWHDLGKAHPAFQSLIAADDRPQRSDLAKAPDNAWRRQYRCADGERRGFRHELASALALFAVLQRHQPTHPALLGPWAAVLPSLGTPIPQAQADAPPTPLEQAVLALDADAFDLLAYLVAAHHGKVRVALHAAPDDQDFRPRSGDRRGLPVRGVREGDALPTTSLDPALPPLPGPTLTLAPASLGLSAATGRSWRERTLALQRRHSPAALALLEALLIAADRRASRLRTADPILGQGATP